MLDLLSFAFDYFALFVIKLQFFFIRQFYSNNNQ